MVERGCIVEGEGSGRGGPPILVCGPGPMWLSWAVAT
jgi:hypothetical protein